VNIQDIDWKAFEEYVRNKYAKSTQAGVLSYAKKYCNNLNDVKGILQAPTTIRNNIIDALTILAKFNGVNEEFKQSLKQFGITKNKQSVFQSFNRIFNASSNDLNEWENKANTVLKPDEQLFLRYCRVSGLRKEEAINSFNLVISLNQQKKLDTYYYKPYQCLMHFQFEKTFIRGKKNCYITFLSEPMLNDIANSTKVSYNNIRKRLAKIKLPIEINKYRDMFGTFLMEHGILEAEVNLCQGRINASVFLKHYWSPSLKQLGTKILKAFNEIEEQKQPQEPNKYVENVSDKTKGYISFNKQ
jgi:intergrase/recombinase